MNMPFVDKYDTQSAIELARQMVDYRGWYDKVKILLKEIMNCQYVACMNPTAGSFNITPRMQRHFVTFAVQMPSAEIVRSIYFQIMDGHLSTGGFDADVARLSGKLVDAAIELHSLVSGSKLCSAISQGSNGRASLLADASSGLAVGVAVLRISLTSAELSGPVQNNWLQASNPMLTVCTASAGNEQLPAFSCEVPLPVQLA